MNQLLQALPQSCAANPESSPLSNLRFYNDNSADRFKSLTTWNQEIGNLKQTEIFMPTHIYSCVKADTISKLYLSKLAKEIFSTDFKVLAWGIDQKTTKVLYD